MLRKAIPLLALCIVVSVVISSAAAAFLPPTVLIRKLSAKELNGRTPEQAVWSRPLSIPRFEYYVCDYLPTQQTQVRLAYDDRNLYVAYHCLEENMAKFKTSCAKRDESVWTDDSVGIDLDIKHTHTFFHRLWSNAAGVTCDQDYAIEGLREGNTAWNMDWTATGAKAKDGWNVFMTIPFKSLGLATPRPGTAWGVNLARRSVPEFERSCWATCRPAIQDIPAWGHFVFGGPDTPIVYIAQSEANRFDEWYPCRDRAGGNVGRAASQIAVPGQRPMTVKILNPTSAPMKLRLDVLIDDKVTASHRTSAVPGASDWNLKFEFPYEGLHELRFAVYDGSGKMLMRSAYQLVLVPSHTARLAKYREMAKAQRPKSASAKSEKADIEKSLGKLATFARSARGNLAKWKQLGTKLDVVSMRVQHLRCACADTAGRGYAVGTETALTKIMRDEMFAGEFGKPAAMSLAKNEYESAQVCVLAYNRPLKGVQVTVSELKGPGGAVIPADKIASNLVDWVDCKKARYAADLYGWVPDPLMDMAPFNVAKGALKPIWITVHTPESIPGGNYTGTISIKPADAPATQIPIAVKVWDFAVPTRLKAKTAFTFSEGEVPAWYGTPYTQEERRKWYDFLLQYHISPTNIYSGTPQPAKEDIPFCVERGMNAFTLSCTWYKTEKDLNEMEGWMREYEKYLKDNGWWDMPYIYGFDELGPERFQELRDTYGGIKKRFPDLKTMTTIAPQPELKGYVDMWCPQTNNYVREVADKYRKDGDEVWWYVCCNPGHPWPNYFVDFNAADPRILWWMSWKENVPGILYYYTDSWEVNRRLLEKDAKPSNDWERALVAGKRWPEIKWSTNCGAYNGDGQLLYPGPNGNPIASIRMASIRDGAEDFEYFYILDTLARQAETKPRHDRDLVAKARKLARVRDDVVKSPTEYSTDPKAILDARQEVAEMIEKMRM